jgi:hypothetical protein
VPFSNVAFMKKSFVAAQSIDSIVIDEANHFIRVIMNSEKCIIETRDANPDIPSSINLLHHVIW